jgi:hypothetical protein
MKENASYSYMKEAKVNNDYTNFYKISKMKQKVKYQ